MLKKPIGTLPLTMVEKRGIKKLIARLELEEDSIVPTQDVPKEETSKRASDCRITINFIREVVGYL